MSDSDPEPNSEQNLLAISPVDGRYRHRVEALGQCCSEFALMRYRVAAEVAWLQFLANEVELTGVRPLGVHEMEWVEYIHKNFKTGHALRIREIEGVINHDVKAIEYFVKEELVKWDLDRFSELVHFGCTSEDINNIAYAMMLRDVRDEHLGKTMKLVIQTLLEMASKHTATAMLSRTHGQSASPTTIGKELVNVASRLLGWLETFKKVEIKAKMNGAVGNFNAHEVAAPDVDWFPATNAFIESLGFTPNQYTTQIEPHDWIAQYLNALIGFNQVLLDFDRDIWGYISLGYFNQRKVEIEVGSSTMPHKINPIDFENSEGNIGMANATARHLADKLLVSRYQRDLTDSTALRNIGTVFAQSMIAMLSTIRGIGKLEVRDKQLAWDLDRAWEILAEPVQTLMRRVGFKNPYEEIKLFTRGRFMDEYTHKRMITEIELEDEERKRLTELTPSTYTGLAAEMAEQGIKEINEALEWL